MGNYVIEGCWTFEIEFRLSADRTLAMRFATNLAPSSTSYLLLRSAPELPRSINHQSAPREGRRRTALRNDGLQLRSLAFRGELDLKLYPPPKQRFRSSDVNSLD